MQSIMSLHLKWKKLSFWEKWGLQAASQSFKSDCNNLSSSMLIIKGIEKHVGENLFVSNEFSKFYVVILLHLPSRLIISLLFAKPSSTLWIITWKGVFPLLRNTALMFTHNTILRDLWWKRNHKCLPLWFTKTDTKHF